MDQSLTMSPASKATRYVRLMYINRFSQNPITFTKYGAVKHWKTDDVI